MIWVIITIVMENPYAHNVQRQTEMDLYAQDVDLSIHLNIWEVQVSIVLTAKLNMMIKIQIVKLDMRRLV